MLVRPYQLTTQIIQLQTGLKNIPFADIYFNAKQYYRSLKLSSLFNKFYR